MIRDSFDPIGIKPCLQFMVSELNSNDNCKSMQKKCAHIKQVDRKPLRGVNARLVLTCLTFMRSDVRSSWLLYGFEVSFDQISLSIQSTFIPVCSLGFENELLIVRLYFK